LPRSCYQRAVAFVTDARGRLLVFDHVHSPEAGTQVPAGGIKRGEQPDVAVLRELAEESGVTTARIVRKLGESWYRADDGLVPAGYEEQVHHVFHLLLDEPTHDGTWRWDDYDGGTTVVHEFEYRWVALTDAATVLNPDQAMWIASLRCSAADVTAS
jgi:8-oxo-dGTP pyrophosphatase MutT (NUDIX family)